MILPRDDEKREVITDASNLFVTAGTMGSDFPEGSA